MKASTTLRVLAVSVCLVVVGVGAGCSGQDAGETLTLGYLEWDENVAVSNLTKVILEEELGYDDVELKRTDIGPVFDQVADGEVDGFQDVWLPNHEDRLAKVEGEVERLGNWYDGQTDFGIAVPTYMKNVESIEDLDDSETDMIIGIEPGSDMHETISKRVIPDYGLDLRLVESSTPAMLSELEQAYLMQEPIVFLGWSPHWMNAEYDFRYLEDPKDAQGDLDESSEITSIVRSGLAEEDPVAYSFLSAVSLTEEQVNELESSINATRDPIEGAGAWLEDNREVVEPWIQAAEKTENT
jgi:glycine betaine/proline transport system substrate-binding protein